MKISTCPLLAIATLLPALAAHAADYVVTSPADAGAGTLRQAILDANASADNDAITFSPTAFAARQTITLTTGVLTLTNNGSIAITGSAAGVTISGGGRSQVFTVNSATATLTALTISDGFSRAFTPSGGGINNGGTLTINNSTLSGNTSGFGGGIYSGGTLTLNNSTISGNTGSSSFARNGGGIYNFGTLTVNNSTIAGNTAGTGGGIFNQSGGTVNLFNSIVAGNTAPNSANVSGTSSGANNITSGDPLLNALADNGGPTFTRSLQAGSPALDMGAANFAGAGMFDQRGTGFARVSGGRLDIGAFEVQVLPTVSNVTLATNEDTTFTFAADSFDSGFQINNASAQPQSVRIDSLPVATAGILNFNGNAATAGQVIARADLSQLSFVPAADFNGSASFGFNASDGSAFAATGATATITIAAVNDAPSFTLAAAPTVNEDSGAQSIADFLTNSSAGPANESGQTLTTSVGNDNNSLFSTQPAIATDGTLTFTSAPNANGTATVTVMVQDSGGTDNGGVDTTEKTFIITVNPVNDAPVATSRTESVDRNTATPITLNATDVESDTLTYQVLTQPTNGTLTGTAPNLTYTPNASYSGPDSFTFKANDGTVDSDIGTITLVVGANNVAPVAFSQKVTTNEEVATAITLTSADSNNDSLTYKVIAAPAHGTLTGTAPNLTYTPNANFNGADSFTFSTNDGTVDSNIATVSVGVTAVNDAPSFTVGADKTIAENAVAQSVTNFATNISAGPSDESGQKLTFTVTNDNNALFTIQPAISADGTLTYAVAPNAVGKATVSVTLQDNGGTANGGVDTSAAQTFVINVTASPLFVGVSLNPDGPFTNDTVTATPRISDKTGVTFNYEFFVNGKSVQNGAGNTLDLSKPGFGDKGDKVSVTLTAANAQGGMGTATNQITVRNSVPFAFSGTATAKSGVETLIPFRPFGNPGGGDSDLDVVTYKRVGGPVNGTGGFVTNADGSIDLRYQSRLGFTGVEAIRFVAVDNEGRTSNIATLGINVTGGLPTAQDVSGQTTSGVSVDVPLSGNDPNGGVVTFKRVGGPKNGTGGLVTLPDGTTVMRYIPRANFVGVEEIRYVALSAAGRPSNVATIRINVSASTNASGASAMRTGDAPSGGRS